MGQLSYLHKLWDIFAAKGNGGSVLGHVVRVCGAGMSRDAAHVHRYPAGKRIDAHGGPTLLAAGLERESPSF